MTDTVTKARRSEIMSLVRGKDTKPEIKVRSFLHRKGLRYRLHANNLPGKPDMVLPKYKTVVFIHGCFWHGHKNCKLARVPKSNIEFWNEKIQGNARRDEANKIKLNALGWRVLTVWECELTQNDLDSLARTIKAAKQTHTAPAARSSHLETA